MVNTIKYLELATFINISNGQNSENKPQRGSNFSVETGRLFP